MTRPFTEAERKLRWQCRRGLKELDVLFEPFMEQHYLDLSEQDQAIFTRIMEQEDVDLLAWFMGYQRPDDPEFVHIVDVVLKRLAS